MSGQNFGRRHEYFELFFLLLPSSAEAVPTVPTLQRMPQFKYQSYHAKSWFAFFFLNPVLTVWSSKHQYKYRHRQHRWPISGDSPSQYWFVLKILVVYMTSWICPPFQTTLCKCGINTPASFQIFVSSEKVLATQYISADVEWRKFIYTFCEIYSRKLNMQNRLFSCSGDPCWKTIPCCSTPKQQTLCYHQAR